MLRKEPFVTGDYYHIYNRGIDKRIIFKSTADYERFLMLLYIANSEESIHLDIIRTQKDKKFSHVLSLPKNKPLVSIGAWCLMPNHFHLLVKQEIDGGITKFMKKIGTGYSMYFNAKYKRQGALFGGLFKSVPVRGDQYLKHLFGYIHLNPLEIRFHSWKEDIKRVPKNMSTFLDTYRYSSYLEYQGKKRVEGCIVTPGAFPFYFKNTKQFNDFITSYFSIQEL